MVWWLQRIEPTQFWADCEPAAPTSGRRVLGVFWRCAEALWRPSTPKAHYLLRVVALVARKSLWPRTTVATKTKKTLLSRVVVAFVAFLCPLFLYQNAAVLYLNVDVAIFCCKEIWDQPKNHGDFRWLSEKKSRTNQSCFLQKRPQCVPASSPSHRPCREVSRDV